MVTMLGSIWRAMNLSISKRVALSWKNTVYRFADFFQNWDFRTFFIKNISPVLRVNEPKKTGARSAQLLSST
jgi:hypothetical protein